MARRFCLRHSLKAPIRNILFTFQTIPRILDALLDQARYRVMYAEKSPGKLGNWPEYHLLNSVRYLHLEKPQQRERVLPELAEHNPGKVEAIINKSKRKPLVTLASLQNKELGEAVRQTMSREYSCRNATL
jgi:hypothetical protein